MCFVLTAMQLIASQNLSMKIRQKTAVKATLEAQPQANKKNRKANNEVKTKQ